MLQALCWEIVTYMIEIYKLVDSSGESSLKWKGFHSDCPSLQASKSPMNTRAWSPWWPLHFCACSVLTHLPLVPHICVVNWVSIGSDKGVSPVRRQPIIWTNAGSLLIGPLGKNFNETLIKIQKKMFLKNACENIICEMATILSRGRWVNTTTCINHISYVSMKMGYSILHNYIVSWPNSKWWPRVQTSDLILDYDAKMKY